MISGSAGGAEVLCSEGNSVACHEKTCALRAPTSFPVRIKSIRTGNEVLINDKNDFGFYSRSPIAYGWLFIRTQSVIRADGFSSAQV